MKDRVWARCHGLKTNWDCGMAGPGGAMLVGMLTAVMVGCGGAAGTPSGTTTSATPSLSLSATPSSMTEGGTLAITATTQNDAGKTVSWGCTPVNACGTFSSNDETASGSAVTYTAPGTAESVVITATLADDSGVSKSTPAIAVSAAGTPSIALSTVPNPLPVAIAAGSGLTITATINNGSGNVNWSCIPGNTGSTCGTFTASASGSGVSVNYTAPASAVSDVVITATLADNSSISASTPAFGVTSGTVSPPTIGLSTTPGSLAAGSNLAITATAMNDGENEVNWSCTPVSNCGTFSAGGQTASGTAVTYTAPSSSASVVVTATLADDSSVSASAAILITPTGLTPGIYVFSVSGDDKTGNYSVAGAFTLAANGLITGGEQDFVDYDPTTGQARPLEDTISSGTYATSADGNLTITLVTGDTQIGVNGNGTEILDATLISSQRARLMESDSSATGSGSMELQSSPATPSGAYAFNLSGSGFYMPNDDGPVRLASTVMGGILDFDGAGNVLPGSSAFDVNDSFTVAYLNQLFASGTVSVTPDSFGRVSSPSIQPITRLYPLSRLR